MATLSATTPALVPGAVQDLEASHVKGLDVRINELGFAAIRLHFSCDPLKDINHPDPAIAVQAQKWFDRTRALFPDETTWAQEMEINFWVASGQRVYPEFHESTHVRPLEYRNRKVIYRAWDFGWHAPACLIGQVDPKDRLLLLREVIGRQQTTAQFAADVIAQCAKWYPNHAAGFEDVCDPAGQQARPVANEKNETRDVEILTGLGIFPKWEYGWSRKDGRSLVHQLLRLRTDQTPSLYVDAQGCPVLTQGFLGKYVYPEGKDGRAKDEPDEGNHPWSDTHASLRYLCTGLYGVLGLQRFRHQPVIPSTKPEWMGYGTPVRRK